MSFNKLVLEDFSAAGVSFFLLIFLLFVTQAISSSIFFLSATFQITLHVGMIFVPDAISLFFSFCIWQRDVYD